MPLSADPTLPPPALEPWLLQELPFRRCLVRTHFGRLHVIDEPGRTELAKEKVRSRPTILLCHGNPTWSYLWRKIIPRLSEQGFRCVAPDLFGFGFSDKPKSPSDHQLADHGRAVAEVIDGLALDEIIVVGQDWGGPISCTAARLSGARVRGLVFGNTAVLAPARPFRSKAFHRLSHLPWVSDALFLGLGFPLGRLDRVQGHKGSIGRQQSQAYRFPFRRFVDRAGPLGLARMVPQSEAHPSTAITDENERWLRSLDVPTALVWGRKDPILGSTLRRHRRFFPKAMVTETDAGHFLQEEVPDLFAEAIIDVATAVANTV